MHNINYRRLCGEHLSNAKKQLDTLDDSNLKYAALELRMSMEGLTYDRAIAYKNEFPQEEYKTWQPKQIMSVLLEIDSAAGQDRTLAFGVEGPNGTSPSTMQLLGTETVLNMNVIKKHYQALGSYLHMQSMNKMLKGDSLNYDKIRCRCNTIYEYIMKVFDSPFHNCTLGRFTRGKCMKCERIIRKRIPRDKDKFTVICHHCSSLHHIERIKEGSYEWRADKQEMSCPGCKQIFSMWRNEVEIGHSWNCNNCGAENKLVLAIQHVK